MNAGELRDTITIQQIDGVTGVWANLATDPVVPAAIDSQGGESYRIRIRYRSDLFGLQDANPKGRVLYQDRVLFIEDVIESDRRREVTLLAAAKELEIPNLQQGVVGRKAWP